MGYAQKTRGVALTRSRDDRYGGMQLVRKQRKHVMVTYMNNGWNLRLNVLRRTAEHDFLAPLRMHAWTATIEREVAEGEYLLIAAERGGHRHVIALLYTSATDNAVYKRAALEAEHIFFNGEPYKVSISTICVRSSRHS
jgi:hypothetical protein